MPKINESLGQARTSRNDEFYTQFHDIEKEIEAYLEFDENAFRGKTVLLPCDDPEWSNFTKYFAQKFADLGLKKLISTSYAPISKPADIPYQPTLFEVQDAQFDPEKTQRNGKIFTLSNDVTRDGKVDVNDLQWTYLEGDGDFRSKEICDLMAEADIVVTNPPFSLFREFLSWLVEADKKFLILGNLNGVTYKEVFPLIMENKVWMGVTRSGVGSMWFVVPENSPEKTGQKIENGQKLQTIGNSAWFTNMDHGRRHEFLQLMTKDENVRFSKILNGSDYPRYDNYDAIDVSRVDAIPSDYGGVMGVPITFLSKYNPEQFQIIGITQRTDDPHKTKKYTVDQYPNANDLNARGVILVDGVPKSVYARILIRHIERDEK